MKKRIIVLLIASMIVGVIFTGCSKEEKNVETTSNSETAEAGNTNEKIASDDITEIAKYKVDNIINESDEHGFYNLKYTSKETIDNSFEYFDDVLKGTSGYTTKHLPDLMGYVKGTINGIEINVGISRDEETEDTLVDFSYSVEE